MQTVRNIAHHLAVAVVGTLAVAEVFQLSCSVRIVLASKAWEACSINTCTGWTVTCQTCWHVFTGDTAAVDAFTQFNQLFI